MFTVKHITGSGEEFAMECASYAIEPLDPLLSSNEQRFRLLTFDTPYRQQEHTMIWTGRKCARYPDAEVIHIMNRFGATVASHYFEQDGAPLFGPVHSASAASQAA
jgi:hypothetical protein